MEPQQVAHRHRARAGVALDLGRFAVAEREARAALAADPRDVTAQLYLCRAYLGLSDHERAIAAARGAIGLAPGDGYAYYLAGFAMQVAGRANEAVDMLRESVRLQPSAARFHARLAIALLDARDRGGARAAIDTAIGLEPENTGLIDEAARVYGLLDVLAISEELSRRLVRLEPDAATSHWRLAWALGLAKRHREASECARVALRIDPNYWPGWEELGYALLEQDDGDDAQWALREALRLKPGLTSATINLATLHRRRGYLDDALEVCEAALRVVPDNQRVRRTYDGLLAERERRDVDLATSRVTLVMLMVFVAMMALAMRDPAAIGAAVIVFVSLGVALWRSFRPRPRASEPGGARRP